MSFSTTAIKYGWVYLTALGVLGTTIYKVANTRQQVKPEDIIELAIGTDERIMGLQTADGTYPVERLSFVRTWTSNVYVTNGVTVYTNIVTNTIGWHTDRAMMVELDTKIKAIVPYYKDDTKSNYPALTFTGLLASLSLGDGTNFTRTPAIGTNTATYGDYPQQIYVEDLQERYKVLNALKYSSNSYMMVTGDVVFVWYEAPAPPGLTPGWDGTAYSGGGHYMGFTWSNVVADIEADFAPWPYEGSAGWGPLSTWYAQDYDYSWDDYGILSVASASKGNYKIGPYTNDRSHSVIVEARSVAYGVWSDQGAIGAEGEWVVIIDVTNSLSSWEYSAEFGGIALPEVCSYPGAKGNVNQVRYTTYYGPTPSGFYTNGTLVTNTAFGSNYVFYYCTNKYW